MITFHSIFKFLVEIICESINFSIFGIDEFQIHINAQQI